MNKSLLPLCLLCNLLFACTTRVTEENRAAQLEASLKAKEKVNKVVEQLHRDCDSILLQQAVFLADSIRQAARLRKKQAPAKRHRWVQ